MSKLFATIALAFMMIFVPIASASANTGLPIDPASYPACTNEDGSGQTEACYWDAQARGNGLGQSVIIYEDDSYDETYSLSNTLPSIDNYPPAPEFPACINEDGSGQEGPCYWDAQMQGNGLGQSVVNNQQMTDMVTPPTVTATIPVPTYTEPTTPIYTDTPCPTGEDTTAGLETVAWDLFDSSNAADLLPSTASTVTFTASSDHSSPIAPTLDTIVCTDMLGNTYQFTIS